MKINFKDRKRKILRTVFGTLSFSTALFVFQACYGTDKDFGADYVIKGIVKSKTTNLPIPRIKVSVENQPQYEYTDNSGQFKIYVSLAPDYKLIFEDIDSTKNGTYLSEDSIIKVSNDSTFLHILLSDK